MSDFLHPLLDPGRRPVIGHRGMAAHAPENTLESFRRAVALGVDALEMDVHLSADGEPVVIHDPTLERTTDARGPVAARTAAELARVDAGARFTPDAGRSFPFRETGLGVPTLRRVLEEFPDMPILLELKTLPVAAAARRVIEEMRAEHRVIVESFLDATKAAFAGSRIAVGAASGDVARLLLPAVLGRDPGPLPWRFMSIPPRHRGLPLPLAGLAALMTRAGGCVHVWTINDAREARRLWGMGVRGIVSDDPGVVLGAREGSG